MVESGLIASIISLFVLNLLLDALLIFFPALTSAVLTTFLFVESALFASMEAFLVTVLFVDHTFVSLFLALGPFLFITLGLCLLFSASLLVSASSLSFDLSLRVFKVGCKSLSVAMEMFSTKVTKIVLILAIFDDLLGVLNLLLFVLTAALFLASFFLSANLT